MRLTIKLVIRQPQKIQFPLELGSSESKYFMQLILLKCVMPVEKVDSLRDSCARAYFLQNLLKRSIALFAEFTQKVDRTFGQFTRKGRSHLLQNLLKRSIALVA